MGSSTAINTKLHLKIALTYFLLAALLGVLLRSFVVVPLSVNYRFIVHTHSHIALLGWVYVALTSVLYHFFLKEQGRHKQYRFIFWFTQCTLLGMLASFPWQGYAVLSIIFSTLFLFASYWFTYFFIRNIPEAFKSTCSYRCIRIALWFLVLSSIGPWALGGIMTVLGPESIWYRLAIYFYLHFQYNGWMLFALLGLLFYMLEQVQISIPQKRFRLFFWSMSIGTILSFFLSTLWTKPTVSFYVLGGIGASLQVFGFGTLLSLWYENKPRLHTVLSKFQGGIIVVLALLLGVKLSLQWLTAIPYFANLAASIIDFNIGYLHWTFLGVITIGILFFIDFFRLIDITKRAYLLYFLGFIATESLIFYKGLVIWQKWSLFDGYMEILALLSFLIPLSLILILWKNKRL
ncbi:hypothetical protein SAMN04487911_11250 [Arenibacter nanhaiticus]|uniref:Cytochrome C and Quinol oxidase polypeptide I n=1 Tax=Arenibacter nanhaiticus TaxID=558155 RepID=A0A1M6GYQ1_9FLAO|nr:hypothetical protein [Arenibacter nanhaiticus]SHJ14985.1 hypothetical protein SAMN04487911_11250 [Arenibacter nanhaiticus]